MSKDSEELLYKKQNGYLRLSKDELDNAFDYSKGYMDFISNAKIEREAIAFAINMAKDKGYSEANFSTTLSANDKVYFNNKDKCLALVKMGKEPLSNGVHIIISHVDSPRLDLKQTPLYEDSEMALLKTHYYGGIKKYQWLTVPLAMHGVVILRDGTKINLAIGESEDDPIFYISDLLPHLSQKENVKTVADAFDAEHLNIICGGIPYNEDEEKAVKYNVLKLLNSKYGIVESDFLSAEVEFVPAMKARDVGFDRAYIAAYGHDDKICAYSGTTAFFDADDTNTCIMYLVDKEEIGSDGVSGAQSKFIVDVIEKLCKNFNKDYAQVRMASKCISADVTSAYDSNFKDVFEASNSSYLSYGVAVNKFTGARGKSGSSDASAELTAYIRNLFDSHDIIWQTGEIGRVDLGGGGTVAKYLANQNIDTIDIGVPVMSMHSPYELISKVDLYSAYKAYKAFFNK